MRPQIRYPLWICCHLLSLALIIATATGWQQLGFTWLETVGAVSGLYAAWLSVLNSHWNWPVGIVNSGAFFILFLRAHLFASTGLQVLFICQEVWGWYLWLKLGPKLLALRDVRPITWFVDWKGWQQSTAQFRRFNNFVLIAVLTLVATIALQPILRFDASGTTFWDALATTTAVTATFLFMWKKLENWWYWILSDLIYVPLLWSQGLHATAGLNAILAINAVIGFANWRAIARAQTVTIYYGDQVVGRVGGFVGTGEVLTGEGD
jgi:nicotinamide mononucleotide transporter